jgi:restriction system protein
MFGNRGLPGRRSNREAYLSWCVGIPDFQTLMRPVLVAIQGDEPKSHAQIRDRVASALGVSNEDRQVMLPSGKQA